METSRDICKEIRQHIVDTFLFGQGGDTLTEDTSLLEQGVLDSTGVLDLVQFVEETYGIHVADEELVPENFDTLRRIHDFVRRRIA